MFKEKSSKKRIVSSESAKGHSTLDARHQQMVQGLQDQQTQVDQLVSEKTHLLSEIQHVQQMISQMKQRAEYDTPLYNHAWNNIISFQERLLCVEDLLQKHLSFEEEIDYYENTGYILFQYYDLLSKQGSVEHAASNKPTLSLPRPGKGRKKAPPVSSKSILDAFGCTHNIEDDPPIDANIPAVSPVDKSFLVDEYMSVMDKNHIRPICQDALGMCIRCKSELVCLQQEGTMVCPDCGYQELLLIEQNRPLLRQISKEASHQSYKRINHFREWCSQVQGRESTDIPEDVFEQILQEIKKEKISDPKKITYNKMREILKRLRINKYYEHINFIIKRICGVQTPYFSPELEEKLCSMFKEIQGSFVKHCPVSRKNFLSYSYVLYKFFQILGQQDKQYLSYCKYFMLLKSREKLYVQDQIFKAICEDLGWPVIPTL